MVVDLVSARLFSTNVGANENDIAIVVYHLASSLVGWRPQGGLKSTLVYLEEVPGHWN